MAESKLDRELSRVLSDTEGEPPTAMAANRPPSKKPKGNVGLLFVLLVMGAPWWRS